MVVDTLKDTLTTEQLDVTIHSLDRAIINLIGTLLTPLEASEDSDLVSYPREVIWEALSTLSERLEAYMEIQDID